MTQIGETTHGHVPRRKYAAGVVLLPFVAAVWVGCSSNERPGTAASEAEQLERLRALPYVDFAGSEGDTGEDGVVRSDPAHVSPGYTLYTSRKLCMAELIDLAGNVMNGWRNEPCEHWANATLLPGGELLVVGQDPTPDEDKQRWFRYTHVLHLAWDGTILFKAPVHAHHDAQLAPDGNILAIAADHRPVPDFDGQSDIVDNYLVRLTRGGEILERVSFYDLLASGPAGFRLVPAGVRRDGGGVMDLFHANTIAWMPHPHLEARGGIYSVDHVMVTFRNQDTVAIIDWPDKTVLWTWGRDELKGPHDASWLESGNILVFDNGLDRNWSRVVELDPIEKKIVWEYRAPDPEIFYTRSRGGAQRLPNGNTLVTESDDGHVFEITPVGDVVWEFWNPNRNEKGQRATIFKARRYEPSFVAPLLGRSGG